VPTQTAPANRVPAPSDVEPRRRTIARLALGGFLAFAGTSHLTWSRREFQAQVPPWVPVDAEAVVIGSGLVEVVLGTALITVGRSRRAMVGGLAGAFVVAVFPGNVSQFLTRTDAFGLDTDRARATRLAFQPALVAWALWSTGAGKALREARRSRTR
jgi:uncharacterized membrane protein